MIRELCKGKYHCTADLLFLLFGFSCLATTQIEHIYLFGQIQTSQTGIQTYSDTSPYKVSECSLGVCIDVFLAIMSQQKVRTFCQKRKDCYLMKTRHTFISLGEIWSVKRKWVSVSVTRFGNFLHFGRLFKAFGNNYFAQISHSLRQFL